MQRVDSYLEQAAEAADFLTSRELAPADVVVQCGSGLAGLATQLLPQGRQVDLDEIPHLPVAAVTGHGKTAVAGRIADQRVLVLTGRVHRYEGYSAAQAGFTAAIAAACGAGLFIATNAAGALNTELKRGSLVIHNNYINFQGDNPLYELDFGGSPRCFVDPEPPYDPLLAERLARSLAQAGGVVHCGVYVAVRGPVFETLAELRMMRGWGADLVGMSTVPEVIICHLCRLPVVAVSLVTNECFSPGGTVHAEVLQTSQQMAPLLAAGIRGLLEER